MASGFPVQLEVRVAWGEMDAFAHVNNANYLRWFESARIAYFERVGVALGAKDPGPWVPILARATIDFRRPVTYPDTVTVGASVRRVGNTSFTMVYQATSRAQGVVVAEGEAVVVLLEAASGTKLAVPPALRAAIDALEASAA